MMGTYYALMQRIHDTVKQLEREGRLDAPTIEDRVKLLELKFEDLEAQVIRLTDDGLSPITDKDIEWAKNVIEKSEGR